MAVLWLFFVYFGSVLAVTDRCVTREKVEALEDALVKVTRKLNVLEAWTKRKVFTEAGGVSFTVTLTKNQKLTPNSTLVFDDVMLDTAVSYSTSTGVFTAPFYGIYFFSALITTESLPFDVGILKNGTFVTRLVSNGGQASGSVTLNLYPGDRIWVGSDPQSGGGQLRGGGGKNVFTGFQLNSRI